MGSAEGVDVGGGVGGGRVKSGEEGVRAVLGLVLVNWGRCWRRRGVS